MESVKFLSPRLPNARIEGSVTVLTELYCDNKGVNLATEKALKHRGAYTTRKLNSHTRPTERKCRWSST